MPVTRTQFYVNETPISAVITEPDSGAGPFPAVVLCHGFAATKEMLMPDLAAAFASRSQPIATIAFDYRNLGESGGEPRGRFHPEGQIDDVRAAITYLEGLESVDADRLGLWGASWGGGNALYARGVDPRVKAAVVVNPVTSGDRWLRTRNSVKSHVALAKRVREANAAAVREGGVVDIPISEVVPMDPGRPAAILSTWATLPGLPTTMTIDSVEKIRAHRPIDQAAQSSAPLLVILSPEDTVVPSIEGEDAYRAATGVKKLVWLDPECDHFHAYEDPWKDDLYAKSAEWFDEHLG